MNDKRRKIIRPTIAYLLGLSILIWFLYFQSIETPDRLWGYLPGFKLSQLLTPLLSALTLYYLSTIINQLTVGILTKPVRIGLRSSSIFLPLYIASRWPQTPIYLKSLLRLPFYITLVLSILNIIEHYYNEDKVNFNSIFKGMRIGALGLLVFPVYTNTLTELRSLLLTGASLIIPNEVITSPILDSLAFLFRNAALLTMGISILSLLDNVNDSYLRYIGRVSGENLRRKFTVLLVIGSYFTIGRPLVIETNWVDWQLLIASEWLIVTLGFYTGYRTVNRYADSKVEETSQIEDWYKHVQQIEYTSDKNHERVSHLIRNFVENGEKSRLITILASIMAKSNYRDEKMHTVLHRLIEYEEPKPEPIILLWQAERRARREKNRRELVLKHVFNSLTELELVNEHQNYERNEVKTYEA